MESIGIIIRKHRTKKNMTQEELGKKAFVSKQAVSKWETGKTLPDIETIRKLCGILEINKDEILGGSIEETKKSRKWLKACIIISVISITIALFFALGGVDYIERRTQSGVAYVSVFMDGKLLSTEEYRLTSSLGFKDFKNGYKVDIDYGEVRGAIHLIDKQDIEFGFINTNNWHNVHIRLDVKEENGVLSATQTVSNETDNDMYRIEVTKGTAVGNRISVFKRGV